MGTDEVDYRDVELRMFQHVLADDMSEHPVTPEQEQEITDLVTKPANCSIEKHVMLEDPNQNQLIAAPSRLQMEKELERRRAIYRALIRGYTVKDNIFKEPAAEPVKPNPRNKKPEALTQEQQRRLDRIKKTLKKRK